MNKQTETFSFPTPKNLVEEVKCLLALTSFDATNFVFNISSENNSFPISIAVRCRTPNFLEEEYELSDFDTSKKDILEEIKSGNYHDLEDLVSRLGLTYDENMDVSYIKNFPSERKVYTLPAARYETSVINKTLENLLPDIVEVSITIDDIRLRSILFNNQTWIFTKTSYFYTILGFIQSHSDPSTDIEDFIQLIPGSYKSEKIINNIGMDKIDLKSDCLNDRINNGVREQY